MTQNYSMQSLKTTRNVNLGIEFNERSQEEERMKNNKKQIHTRRRKKQ